jgi:membrane protease YdiL (CAAX protease family)
MKKSIIISIPLAIVLWYIMFVLKPFNFWLMMSFSTLLLSAITLKSGDLTLKELKPNGRDWMLGIVSAAALYGIFFVGNELLIWVEKTFPALLPDRSQNLAGIYANRGSLSPLLVAGLLCFPIGFGEEFFWRGFVQRYFGRTGKRWTAFAITTAFYTAVHLSTGNPVLLLAALVCGLFWGGLYAWTDRLPAMIISHMLWDPFIFIVLPIQ